MLETKITPRRRQWRNVAMLGLVVAVIAPLAVLVVAPNRAENAPVISAH